MKKIIALLLALVMLFSLAACGGKFGSKDSTAPPANENGGTSTDGKTDDKSPALAADRNGDGKVTIAYSAIAYSIAVTIEIGRAHV